MDYIIYMCVCMVESDRIQLDRIEYPHVQVGLDTGFGSDTPKSISNQKNWILSISISIIQSTDFSTV